jgi:hypothetical protein
VHEGKSDRIEGREKQFSNNSWRLQHLLSVMIRTENEEKVLLKTFAIINLNLLR